MFHVTTVVLPFSAEVREVAAAEPEFEAETTKSESSLKHQF